MAIVAIGQITITEVYDGQQGLQGLQGPKGEQGIPGTQYYTWIKYATSATGTGMSDSPTGMTYIGLAYNKTTATESTTASDYTWSLIKGDKGDTGVKGDTGATGATLYTWIKYADASDGTGLYDTPTSTTQYIGIAINKTTATESSTKTDYTWSKFKGDQGVQGATGADGKTSYFHIKYSAVASPTSSSQMVETPSTYIGTYVDYVATDSTDPTKYTWSRFEGLQGPNGTQGIPGTNGTDGKTSYLHIKYSNDGGTTFTSNSGETVGTYIGTCTDFNVNDPTSVSSYTWSKIKGDTGATGTGVSSVELQYAKNTSNTTPPVQTSTDWTTTMPSYIEGYYLWVRTKVVYINPSSTVYSTPYLEKNWELTALTYTQYQQLQDKFTWLVKSGTSESTMVLTDTLFSLVSKNISLTADQIKFTGYNISMTSGNWSINDQGNMSIKELEVEGYISTEKLRVGSIDCSSILVKVESATTIYVDSTVSNDSSDFTDGAHYATLQGAIDSIPSMLNGCDVTINLNKSVREDVEIRGFSGGSVYVYFNSNTLYGTLRIRDNGARIACYGGSSSDVPTTLATIKPNTMISAVSREATVVVQSTTFAIVSYMNIYGKTSTTTDYYYAMLSYDGANAYTNGCKIIGCDNGFRVNSLGSMYVAGSTGKVNNFVFAAASGGRLTVNNTTQCNSVATTKTNCATSSQIVISSSFSSWDGATTSTGSNDNTTVSTKTVTYKSSYGDTYRSSTYVGWKNDNTVREGNYGYGNCNGVWLFGTQFANLKGTTITKVTIKITRQSGGTYGAVTHTLKAHNYSSRPGGSPSYISGYSQTFSLATGATTTVTITNATILSAISAGTCKGFGLQSGYTSDVYSVCSGNATVTITYK